MSTVSVRCNIYGNWLCRIGTRTVERYGEKYDAVLWLSATIANPAHRLASTSDITMAHVTEHRARHALAVSRRK